MNDVYLNPRDNLKNAPDLVINKEEDKEEHYRSPQEENRMTFESPQASIQNSYSQFSNPTEVNTFILFGNLSNFSLRS